MNDSTISTTIKSSNSGLLNFDAHDCLPASKYPTIQGYLLKHTSTSWSPAAAAGGGVGGASAAPVNETNSNCSLATAASTTPAGAITTQTSQSAPLTAASTHHIANSTVLNARRVVGSAVGAAFRKKRWFVFTPKTGKLYEFRNQGDSFATSELNIRTASFLVRRSPDSRASSPQQPFIFEIISGTQHLVLEANSSDEGFAWIKNLQTYRQFLSNKQLGVEISTGVGEDTLRDVNTQHSFVSYISQNTQDSQCKDNGASSDTATATAGLTGVNTKQGAKMNDTKPASTKMFGGFVSRMRQNSTNSSTANQPTMSTSGEMIANANEFCTRCKKLDEELVVANDDRIALEDEVKTNRDVIKILQEQLRIFNSEKASSTAANSAESSVNFDSLSKDILGLKIQVKCLNKENERLSLENRQLLKTKEVLQEMLENRDRTMVSLTHQVYDLESKNSRMTARAELEKEFLQEEMSDRIQQKLQQLQDTVIAFEHQNDFLNKEIIQQNEIRQQFELREKQSQAEKCEIEAKCSQVQSKLLSLLKELKHCIQEEERTNSEDFHNLDTTASGRSAMFVTNDAVKLLVNRLLEESSLDIPLSWRPGNRPRNWSVSESATEVQQEQDELGFYMSPTDGHVQHSKTYDLNMGADLGVWRNRWDQFMSNVSSSDGNFSTLKNGELKGMLRNGVPQDYRCKIWKMLVNRRVIDKRSRCGESYYETLTKHCGPSSVTSPARSVTGATAMIDPSTKQIELDLLRTLPHNRHFENLESEGIKRLRKVLQAFSLHNQAVGYCQGLNRLAAVTLLFMPEEEAFWTLVAIVETIMPAEYFSRNLLGAHVDQLVLRDLIAEKLPQLSCHMEENCIEISLFGWFLTAFVDSMPVSVYLHIWDVFLNEGSKVLFRFALAILKLYEPELLLMNDSVSFNQFLRTLGEKHFDLRRLSEIAFRVLNPFSTKSIQNKRHHYGTMVREELRKMEEIRDQIHRQEREDQDKDSAQHNPAARGSNVRQQSPQRSHQSESVRKNQNSSDSLPTSSQTESVTKRTTDEESFKTESVRLISFDDDSDN